MYWALPSGRSRLSRASAYRCLSWSLSIVVTRASQPQNLTHRSRGSSTDDPQPEVRRLWRLSHAPPFERDVRSSRVIEEPDSVAQHHGRDEHEDFVQRPHLEALPSDAGAEDVDVLVAGGRGHGFDGAAEVADEGDTGDGRLRRVVREHELRSA